METGHRDCATSLRRVASAVVLGGLGFGLMAALSAEPVPVRYPEGIVHGFLVLRGADGAALADGDLIQVPRGTRVTTRLVFHFKDGSLHDETVVFSQRGRFRLLKDHLVQTGPAFPRALDLSIDGVSGQVHVKYTDEDGKDKERDEHFDLPSDLANGLVLTMLKNARPDAPPSSLSLIVATPDPRLVRLLVTAAGEEPFRIGAERRTARHYVLKVKIGGVAGLLAPIAGKVPPDSHVWILGGEAPTFIRAEQPFYNGGPLWRMELVSPSWR